MQSRPSRVMYRCFACTKPLGSRHFLLTNTLSVTRGSYCLHAVKMSTIATAASLDHLVLTVKDLDASLAFYEKYLGMKHTSFTSGGVHRHALSFGQQKINLHVSGKEFEPKAAEVQPGSADLCFLVQDKVDDVLDRLRTDGIHILEGGQVVDRTGARGKLRSVYIRDPDGNLVE